MMPTTGQFTPEEMAEEVAGLLSPPAVVALYDAAVAWEKVQAQQLVCAVSGWHGTEMDVLGELLEKARRLNALALVEARKF